MAAVFDIPDSRMEFYVEYLNILKRELDCIGDKEDELHPGPYQRKEWVSLQIKLLEELLWKTPLAKRFHKEDYGSSVKAEEQVMSSIETPRYLCISSDSGIWCLDLKLRKDGPLVKCAELNNSSGLLHLSAGLFKRGSCAYVIWGADTHSNEFYRFRAIGTPDGAILSPIKLNSFGVMNKPKMAPIVEQIDGEIHVMESNCFWPGQVFSHEVLYPGAKSWVNMSIKDEDMSKLGKGCITSHLVVGKNIYALVSYKHYMRFDYGTKEWEARPKSGEQEPFGVQNVWNILEIGRARCIGKYPGTRDLYVLVAVVDNWTSPDGGEANGMVGVAYLVNREGSVVCFQHLIHFFFEEEPSFTYIEGGTIINVDDAGNTWSFIGEGYSMTDYRSSRFLYISTFSVEILALEMDPLDENASQLASEKQFVRLAVKDKYIYAKSTPLRTRYPQACFIY